MAQRTQGGLARQRPRRAAGRQRGGVKPRHQPRGNGFHVSFHARDLPGEQHLGARAQLQRGRQQRGRVDVGVAMDLAEAQELGVLKPRNHAENARLLGELQVVLEAHQVEAPVAQAFLAELRHGVGPLAGARVGQAHGFHGAEAQRIAAAARQFFDGQAGFEIRRAVLLDVSRHGLRFQQFIDEAVVLLAVEGAVQIVGGAIRRFSVARGPERGFHVHRIGFDDGADAVIEEQPVSPGQPGDLLGERIAGERAGGDDDDGVLGDGGDFLAPQLDQRLGRDGRGDFRGKDFAIDGERMAAGYSRLPRRFEQQRIEPAQLFLEQPRRGGFLLGLERIAAHQFGQPVRLVRGCRPGRPHFVQHRAQAAPRDLPGRFRPRQPAADDVNGFPQNQAPSFYTCRYGRRSPPPFSGLLGPQARTELLAHRGVPGQAEPRRSWWA